MLCAQNYHIGKCGWLVRHTTVPPCGSNTINTMLWKQRPRKYSIWTDLVLVLCLLWTRQSGFWWFMFMWVSRSEIGTVVYSRCNNCLLESCTDHPVHLRRCQQCPQCLRRSHQHYSNATCHLYFWVRGAPDCGWNQFGKNILACDWTVPVRLAPFLWM